MKMSKLSTLLTTCAVISFAFASPAYAGDDSDKKEDAKWDVSNPPGDKHDIDINTENRHMDEP